MDFFNNVIRFFQDGGSFMLPIAIVLVIGIAIAIERWIYLTFATQTNRRAFNQILPLLKKKDYSAIVKMGQSNGAPVSRMVAAGVIRMSESPRRDDIELAMEEGVLEAMPRLEKRTGYLATLANIATLLGLLGTIIGLIAAFTAVANADPTEKASLLSSSISVAMNTTAFGLISAIPLLLAHALLQTKTTEIIDSLEMAGVKCLNVLAGGGSSKTRTSDPGSRVDL